MISATAARRSGLLSTVLCLVALFLPMALNGVWAQSRGYSLGEDRVEVRTEAHWQAWDFPRDMVTITPSGSVQSRFIQIPHNAILDAADFSYPIDGSLRAQYANSFQDENNALLAHGGIKRAGSNPQLAERAIDADPATAWEPAPADPLRDWVLEIDLGRLVSATKVVVRFAAEGDPFLQFRVHSAGGQNPFGTADRSGALDYTLVGSTTQPNRDQRVFEFDLAPLGTHTEEWTGRLMQYLRVAATATNGERAQQLSAEDYQVLAAEDQGAVEYVWKIAGEERLVAAERYAQLPFEQQGGVRHYRRERPQLAEVEVWSVGENIALGIVERGGSLHDVNPNSSPELAVDGNVRTEWQGMVYFPTGETAEWGLLNVNLGSHFLVHAVRIITRVGGRNLIGYLLRGSDGSLAPDGSLIWEELSGQTRQLNQNTRLFEDRFAPRPLRFLEFRNLDIARRTRAHEGHRILSTVTEIQVFATGHLPMLEMTSDLIDLESSKTLTTIEWEANTPSGTAVEVRTRTGNDLREVNRYFKKDGTEVANKEEYDAQPSFYRGEILTEFLPGPGWSNWSQVYVKPGEVILSPNPRRYMMIQTRLLSEDAATAPSLQSIQVHFTAPLVERIDGEIEPKQNVSLGELTDFELFIRPSFAARDPGFDRIRLIAPSRANIELRQVSLGDESGFVAGNEEIFAEVAKGRFENGAGEGLEVAKVASDTLQLGLPRILRRGSADLVRLSFSSRVFLSGATFAAEVGRSTQADNWQRVDPADPVGDELAAGEGLTVLTTARRGQLGTIEVAPTPFTPNGDGINDTAVFSFAVLKVNVARQVAVYLYDLAGREVRRLSERRTMANGLYRLVWDGRDEGGDLVSPGLYLARVKVDDDAREANSAARLVGVAY